MHLPVPHGAVPPRVDAHQPPELHRHNLLLGQPLLPGLGAAQRREFASRAPSSLVAAAHARNDPAPRLPYPPSCAASAFRSQVSPPLPPHSHHHPYPLSRMLVPPVGGVRALSPLGLGRDLRRHVGPRRDRGDRVCRAVCARRREQRRRRGGLALDPCRRRALGARRARHSGVPVRPASARRPSRVCGRARPARPPAPGGDCERCQGKAGHVARLPQEHADRVCSRVCLHRDAGNLPAHHDDDSVRLRLGHGPLAVRVHLTSLSRFQLGRLRRTNVGSCAALCKQPFDADYRGAVRFPRRLLPSLPAVQHTGPCRRAQVGVPRQRILHHPLRLWPHQRRNLHHLHDHGVVAAAQPGHH
ncbi:hypothetical protein VHUM_01090 [Vanrija humicola]|uniref:Uncharacterized protein n=1 Tax=Vanrija humicola TaxID=5417 RepID=A0A7D8V2T7_VANHU|nr:hypothetical protein VHUM_01090 [Vanrija humicola]